MYLLNQSRNCPIRCLISDLHSTMYLLNLFAIMVEVRICQFTFHYVSIKSRRKRSSARLQTHLHSTMYLLNPTYQARFATAHSKFTFHYVSIKSQSQGKDWCSYRKFTFHYVSIKSNQKSLQTGNRINLHSTMYLLNLVGEAEFVNEFTDLHSTMYLLNP